MNYNCTEIIASCGKATKVIFIVSTLSMGCFYYSTFNDVPLINNKNTVPIVRSSDFSIYESQKNLISEFRTDFFVYSKFSNIKQENIKRIEHFSSYKQNWNGYGAEPIDKIIIDRSIEFLNTIELQPKVFPTSRSTVQFEWHSKVEKYLEIEIFENEYSIYTDYNGLENEYNTQNIEACFDEIKKYFS